MYKDPSHSQSKKYVKHYLATCQFKRDIQESSLLKMSNARSSEILLSLVNIVEAQLTDFGKFYLVGYAVSRLSKLSIRTFSGPHNQRMPLQSQILTKLFSSQLYYKYTIWVSLIFILVLFGNIYPSIFNETAIALFVYVFCIHVASKVQTVLQISPHEETRENSVHISFLKTFHFHRLTGILNAHLLFSESNQSVW